MRAKWGMMKREREGADRDRGRGREPWTQAKGQGARVCTHTYVFIGGEPE